MPKKTVESIINTGNDYCLQAKANQPTLLAQIEANIEGAIPLDVHETLTKQKGRIENRQVAVYDKLEGIDTEKWLNIKYIVQVNSFGYRKSVPYEQTHYFISSIEVETKQLKINTIAQTFAKAIRNHWLIENGLHWSKDVVLKEDKSAIKNKSQATALSIIRTIAYNIAKICNMTIKIANEHFAHNIRSFLS